MKDVRSSTELVFNHIQQMPRSDKRKLIAIGGAPASGKSTLASQIQMRLEEEGYPCGLVPMDGFHLDNEILVERGLLDRKGAPETFDIAGFVRLINRLSAEKELTVPLFDRGRDCVIEDAGRIKAQHQHVIIEGNYLFLNDGVWKDLHSCWNLSVFISPPQNILKERLIQRWLDNGLDETAAKVRALVNDIPNGKLILSKINRQIIDVWLE